LAVLSLYAALDRLGILDPDFGRLGTGDDSLGDQSGLATHRLGLRVEASQSASLDEVVREGPDAFSLANAPKQKALTPVGL